ncbi:MAG: TonB-dependent receptor [Acidobacteria bacterium]|nr:TonB-dependent receptor [Acidobacteriota bacterium]
MKKTLYAVFAGALCIFSQIASAQTITASITGTVSDPSGAVVPNVKVTATNTSTNQAYNANSNESGVYNLLFLPVGNYNVSAEIQGFKRTVLGPFGLQVNQIARVDVKLEVGDTTQSVEIKDFAPVLQTESTATGDTIESTKLTAIPLNGRNYASLLQLMPGAISTSPNAMNTSGRFQGSGSRPQVNGNREQTNNFLLDGIDVNDSIDNRIGYNPNVDALEEVKVITGNGSSEFGNAGGAIVNATIKSGTNAYHGNVFEFLRNEKLDANTFFNNRSNVKKSFFKRNVFGGTFGGPIIKNKAFFFTDYEGIEQRSSGPTSATVAPASWRTGDLSDFLTKQNQVVKDPLTGSDVPSRTAFPGNIIPASRITNPVAKYLFSNAALYPLPNNAGTGALGITSNYLSGTATTLKNHQGDMKIDYRPNEKDSFMGRWSMGRYDTWGSQAALPVFMTGGTYGPTQIAMVNWTRTFSNTIVNEARAGFSRIGIDDKTIDWSGQLGATGNQKFGIPGGQFISGLSAVALGNGLSGIGSGASIGSTRDNKFTYTDNLTWQKGTHLLKMGAQAIRFQQNRYYAGNNGALGSFTYDGTFSGLAYGDFLLDSLSAKGRGAVTGKWGHRHWLTSMFIQDDWKFRRNLTVNLGMRWEYNQPIYEVADRQVNIDTFTGKLLYAGKDGNSRALYNPYYKQFEPRIGIAYTPTSKLVFRIGYAISTFLEGTGANLRLPLNPPYFTESNVNYDPRTPGSITTGFTDVISAGNLASPRTSATPFYQGRAWDQNLRPQFTQQYNSALEYQINKSSSLNVAYVGQLGTHLVVPHEANNPIAGTGPVSSWTASNDRRPLYLNGSLPNVGNIALTESSARMSYNALQVTGRRRFADGLEFVTTYTWSHSMMENLGYYGCGSVNSEGAYWQDAYNRRGNRGPSCFDAKHNFTLGGTYDIPVGIGKKFGSSMNRVADLIVGGWNASYFASAHSGFPVTIFASSANTGGRTPRGNVRANAYRPYTITTQDVDHFYGVVTASNFCAAGVDNGSCAFGIPAVGSLGNAGVGTMRAPSFFNFDASIGKKFFVKEKQYVDFRMELFNAFNHASWGPPGRDITNSGAFGQITSQVQNPRNIQFGLKYYF